MENTVQLDLLFTPDGFAVDDRQEGLDEESEKLQKDFEENPYQTLYQLGFSSKTKGYTPSMRYLQFLAETVIQSLSRSPILELARENTPAELEENQLEVLEEAVPFSLGTEYINRDWILQQVLHLQKVFSEDAAGYTGTMKNYFASRSQNLQTAQRIYFHLVENKNDEAYPFAFLATYARISDHGRVRHVPLHKALEEFDARDPKLLAMLGCLSRACDISEQMDRMVTSGEMFHPLRFTSEDAYTFLKSVPALEEQGILCRIPNWWRKKQSSVSISVNMGPKKQALLGMESLIETSPELIVNGVKLTKKEIRQLLEAEEGLVLIKGNWVEVDRERLQKLLSMMEEYQQPLSLLEALQMQAGMKSVPAQEQETVEITNGKWLSSVVSRLRHPENLPGKALPKSVHATLRPYQKTGYHWLQSMQQLGLGACLADDMGLGKTLQVLSFLESLRRNNPQAENLLIVPASLLSNWRAEASRFTPDLPVKILHGKSAAKLEEELTQERAFLNITTYGMALRMKTLKEYSWEYIILDEAQAIKNPKTRQTRAIKAIPAKNRLALTGTPIENDLSNLWSLFDFLNAGLLGTAKEFSKFASGLEEHPENYGKLKKLVSLFMLRRLKSDKSIVSDLPDKIEENEYIDLTKKQVVLYQKEVKQLEMLLNTGAEGIQRKGAVLSALTRLKQICNHPDQYLGQKEYEPALSGKFEFLKDLCLNIYERHECVLVFSQYREMTEELNRYLEEVFGRKGRMIHGGTPVSARQKIVEEFNRQDTYIPYMVLSLKAAGTGLNLTAASHVIHFDRWWNPAVENQATDRAYRIGQTKNVLVHKFICRGTIEEKINDLMESKKELAENVISNTQEVSITELSNDELLSMLRYTV